MTEGRMLTFTCKECKQVKPKGQMASRESSNRWFEVCSHCCTAIERAELQRDIDANKKAKARRTEIATKVQEAAKGHKAPHKKREAIQNALSEFEENQKRIDLRAKAQRELAHRELCRRDLLAYIQRFNGNYKAGWVHRAICHKLEKFFADVRARKAPRLMLAVPPRHGKSEIASKNFPSWAMGNWPGIEIMLASYAVSLALDFSKDNRDRIKDSAIYHQLFPETRVNPKAEGAEYWRTTAGGGFLAAGVGGPLTGRGADIFIVDDPVKNYEEAESETVREATKNWWRSTARTRLSPGGGVLIIQTRWHDDDLSGFLQREYQEMLKDGVPEEELEKYEVVSFPAEAEDYEYLDEAYNLYTDPEEAKEAGAELIREPGDPLHPERWNLSYLRQARRTMGERLYGALYQQNPVPDSGDFFRAEDFRYYNIAPHLGPRPVYFAWDFAMSQRQTGDYTVGVAAMYNENGDLVILDIIRGRWRTQEIADRMVDLVERYKHNAAKLGVEQGIVWNAVRDAFFEKMKQRNLSVSIDYSLRPVTDKRVRALPLQAWMQSGRVKFPTMQPWMEQARAELLRFDAGVHDDVVDALAWLVRMVQDVPRPDIALLRRSRDRYLRESKEDFVDKYMRRNNVQARSSYKRYLSG